MIVLFFNYSSFTLSDNVNFLLQLNPITYSSLIRYQILFFTLYQSPARGCKAALCTRALTPLFGNGAGAHGIGKISGVLTKIGKFDIALMYDVSIARLTYLFS